MLAVCNGIVQCVLRNAHRSFGRDIESDFWRLDLGDINLPKKYTYVC